MPPEGFSASFLMCFVCVCFFLRGKKGLGEDIPAEGALGSRPTLPTRRRHRFDAYLPRALIGPWWTICNLEREQACSEALESGLRPQISSIG